MNRYMFRISTGGVVNFFADSYDEAWQQLIVNPHFTYISHRCELDELEKDCTEEEYNTRPQSDYVNDDRGYDPELGERF